MAVGRWVYTAQQIAAHIVVQRDILDRFLRGLSNFDLRVAWIGWLLRTIVWAIRALVDTVFSIVILAERALAREMELQADLVAVSLTGSEPLIHALHRLGAADDALDRALAFTGSEANAGRRVDDLFALQTEMVARKRHIRADPTWGEVPAAVGEPAMFRLFKAQLASPPQMWSTHPPNDVREDNAKRRFVAAPIDGRSASEGRCSTIRRGCAARSRRGCTATRPSRRRRCRWPRPWRSSTARWPAARSTRRTAARTSTAP